MTKREKILVVWIVIMTWESYYHKNILLNVTDCLCMICSEHLGI